MRAKWDRAILHLDMDAFFVNVYLLDHPEDRGKPIAVGGRTRGVVASASYEARAFGIRSAMPTARALKLCPELKMVKSNWDDIRECSRLVMETLDAYGPVEKMSVDEAYVDLSDKSRPEALAEIIRGRVKKRTGLPCSVGLATSKLVAKVASDHDKPEGLTIVPPGTEATFLAPLSVRALHGIGPRTAEKLNMIKIYTCADLQQIALAKLRLAFGKHAESMQQRASGVDEREVHADRGPAKSISQERTFNDDMRDQDYLEMRLEEMCETVAQSLQKREMMANTVTVKFRWPDFTTFTRQRSLETPIEEGEDIFRVARAILREHRASTQSMRLLGVGVSNLSVVKWRQLELKLR